MMKYEFEMIRWYFLMTLNFYVDTEKREIVDLLKDIFKAFFVLYLKIINNFLKNR